MAMALRIVPQLAGEVGDGKVRVVVRVKFSEP